MKRLWRRMIALLAGVSLSLCLATAALWVRTYFVSDTWLYSDLSPSPSRQVGYAIATYRGECGFECYFSYDNRSLRHFASVPDNFLPDPKEPGLLGFYADGWPGQKSGGLGPEWWEDSQGNVHATPPAFKIVSSRNRNLFVPLWFLTLTFAIAPAIAFWRWRRGRRIGAGFCEKCGYDLRATHERCPECGTVPPT